MSDLNENAILSITTVGDPSGIQVISESLKGFGGESQNAASGAQTVDAEWRVLDDSTTKVGNSFGSAYAQFRAVRFILGELATAADAPSGPMRDLNDATGGAVSTMARMAEGAFIGYQAFGPLGAGAGAVAGLMVELSKQTDPAQVSINKMAAQLVTTGHAAADELKPGLMDGAEAISTVFQRSEQLGGGLPRLAQAHNEATASALKHSTSYQDLSQAEAQFEAAQNNGTTGILRTATSLKAASDLQDSYAAAAKEAGSAITVVATQQDLLNASLAQFTSRNTAAVGSLNEVAAAAQAAGESLAEYQAQLGTSPQSTQIGTSPLEVRASGGPVRAGQMYMTGEMGRELFVAPENGYIIPNDATERLFSQPSMAGIGSGGGGGGVQMMVINNVFNGDIYGVDNLDRHIADVIKQVASNQTTLRGYVSTNPRTSTS